MIPFISAGEVGLAGKAIGSGERSNSVIIFRCNGGDGIECGLNTVDNSSASVSAFSLSVTARELFGRRRGGVVSFNLRIDYVLRQSEPFCR